LENGEEAGEDGVEVGDAVVDEGLVHGVVGGGGEVLEHGGAADLAGGAGEEALAV